jgi:hypothetical protein
MPHTLYNQSVPRREQKRDMKRDILQNRQAFLASTTTYSIGVARLQYDYWVSLPEASGAGLLTVTAFGGVNMNPTFPGTLASPVLRMGHLRMFDPVKYGPCTDPYTEYADNESVYLPTLKTSTSQKYKLSIDFLSAHIDLTKGVLLLALQGTPKCAIFPLSIRIEDTELSFCPSSAKKSNLILSIVQQFGEMDWPYPVPPWVRPDLCTKPLKVRECSFCHKRNSALLECSNCRNAHYCDKTCQKRDWKKEHKKECTCR